MDIPIVTGVKTERGKVIFQPKTFSETDFDIFSIFFQAIFLNSHYVSKKSSFCACQACRRRLLFSPNATAYKNKSQNIIRIIKNRVFCSKHDYFHTSFQKIFQSASECKLEHGMLKSDA